MGVAEEDPQSGNDYALSPVLPETKDWEVNIASQIKLYAGGTYLNQLTNLYNFPRLPLP